MTREATGATIQITRWSGTELALGAMNPEDRAKDVYRTGVVTALAGFQLVEEGLKTYLEIYFDSMRMLIGDRLHVGFTRADYQNAALGRLIAVFAKTSANTELLAKLRASVARRDHIAHEALLKLYPGNSISVDEYREMLSGVGQVISDTEALQSAIHSEMQKIVASLDSVRGHSTSSRWMRCVRR